MIDMLDFDKWKVYTVTAKFQRSIGAYMYHDSRDHSLCYTRSIGWFAIIWIVK